MIPEERFGRWLAIGVPILLTFGILGATVIRSVSQVPWSQLVFPFSIALGFQIAFYAGAFWAGKWARNEGRYRPLTLLVAMYLWGAGLILMRYGFQFGLLPGPNDFYPFSVCMFLLTVTASLLVPKLVSQAKQDKAMPEK
jgi:RsiW-degrading membrane proteinase PrsW (M82 family)